MLNYKHLRFGIYILLFVITILEICQLRAGEFLEALYGTIIGFLCFPICQMTYPRMGPEYMIASESLRMLMTLGNDIILFALLWVIPFYRKGCFESPTFHNTYTRYWLLAALLSSILAILQLEMPPRTETMNEDLRRIKWHTLYYFGLMLLLAVGPADYQHYRLDCNPLVKSAAYLLLGFMGLMVLLAALYVLYGLYIYFSQSGII